MPKAATTSGGPEQDTASGNRRHQILPCHQRPKNPRAHFVRVLELIFLFWAARPVYTQAR